jgi:hypothetical protein
MNRNKNEKKGAAAKVDEEGTVGDTIKQNKNPPGMVHGNTSKRSKISKNSNESTDQFSMPESGKEIVFTNSENASFDYLNASKIITSLSEANQNIFQDYKQDSTTILNEGKF